MKLPLSILAATALLPGAALAGGLDTPAPEPTVAVAMPPPVSGAWDGFYAGAQLGYGFGQFNLDPRDLDQLDSDGVIGGLHAGYMADLGDWVVGGELQYDAADLSVSNANGASGSFEDIGRLKLRVGRDMGDLLVYGTAGVAYANFSGFDGIADIDVSDPGLVAGLGVDYKVSENWVAGAEYMFHRFNDFGPTGDDVDLNTVHLRVSYQF